MKTKMDNTTNQLYVFTIFIITGILTGVLFDIFRIFRKSFLTPDWLTRIEDILFWLLTGLLILYTIFNFNNGEIRFYLFLGIVLGIAIYLSTFSKFFIRINVKIISILKKFFTILFYPFQCILRFLRKVILKPISFIFINIRKNITHFFTRITTIFRKKSKKNHEGKKDFSI